MTRLLVVVAVLSAIGFGTFGLVSAREATGKAAENRPGQSDRSGDVAAMTRGMEEMVRFCSSERMPQAMNAMMGMARQMGNGDAMAGMVRMMEMMSMMGQMGGQMGGMMAPAQPQSQPQPSR